MPWVLFSHCMTDESPSDEVEKLMDELDPAADEPNKNQNEAETFDSKEELSKEEIQDEFDGEYVASPTGNSQHLVEIDDSQTLCRKDLREKEWPQSSEPGPFNPICKECKSALAGPVVPTSASIHGSLSEIRNWFAERVDVKSPEKVNGTQALRKSELQLVASYIQTLESDNEKE